MLDVLLTASDNSHWLITGIFTVLAALIFWFMRSKFIDLGRSDERIEGKIDKNFTYILKETKSIDRRVARIEGHLKLGPIMSSSPIHLTEAGKEILNESGIKEAADTHQIKLIEEVKKKKPETAYDLQEFVRQLFQDYDFGPEYTKKFKNYSFQEGKWGMYDILDVGAIYFRDIALKELGFDYSDLDRTEPEKQ